jgi:hypothetical protein
MTLAALLVGVVSAGGTRLQGADASTGLPDTERGMYNLRGHKPTGATRLRPIGFVVPSQDEWIKAAYYDPSGGGTFSYWQYPTGPFDPPSASSLNPSSGDVVNAAEQPLSTYNSNAPNAPPGTFPTWCPP